MPVEEILGESLAAFQFGASFLRSVSRNVGRLEGIHGSVAQGHFGSNHDQVDFLPAGKGDDCVVILDLQRKSIELLGHAAVAGRHDHLFHHIAC